jgi:hypothetical protein
MGLNTILHKLLNLTGDDSTLTHALHDEIDREVPKAVKWLDHEVAKVEGEVETPNA